MRGLSNNSLAILLVIAIIFSLFSTLFLLNRFSQKQFIKETTGKASGNLTLTVVSAISIFLHNDTLNFGNGYVNSTCPATGVVNNATLYAGSTYNDTEGNDCWTDNTSTPTSLHLENDGTKNASVTIRGPHPIAFFNNTLARPAELMYRARNYEPNSCDSGATLQTTYANFTGAAGQALCTDFQFQGTRNEIAIDFKVVIPINLTPGNYENTSIVFTAAQT